MCGITIQIGSPDSAQLRASMDLMRHRGPDDQGNYASERVALGHRRLSIIDVSTGHQPIFNETGTHCIVLNGEIYNYQTLRTNLESRHTFRTHTDTEVILHLYEDLGKECVHQLSGMFCFAIHDGNTVFLARDRIGIKPLYYVQQNGNWIFASELKCLQGYSGIREFPPGHTFTPETGFVRYYDLPAADPLSLSLDEAFERVRQLLHAAVEKRLVADVPVGVFLSGGLDSSIIAAIMKRYHDELHSFAVGMEGSEDLAAARIVADHLGTTHHEFVYTRDDMLGVLPDVIYHLESFDAPLVRSSIPGYFVSRLARKHVKVILTGEGSDELFSGYHYLKQIKEQDVLFKELVRITSQLHNTNLQRTDRMTMAHSIEARVPFLDPEVIDFAFRLPMNIRQAHEDRMEKWFLRKAFESYLPESIAWRVKQKFSEGAGSMNVIEEVANDLISDKDFEREKNQAPVPVR